MEKHLSETEYEVLRLSYGLDCDRYSANEIALALNINVSTAIVRVSQIKRDAINQLIKNVTREQVLDLL
jgi:DNA-binding CsgD family transcriptional regulator